MLLLLLILFDKKRRRKDFVRDLEFYPPHGNVVLTQQLHLPSFLVYSSTSRCLHPSTLGKDFSLHLPAFHLVRIISVWNLILFSKYMTFSYRWKTFVWNEVIWICKFRFLILDIIQKWGTSHQVSPLSLGRKTRNGETRTKEKTCQCLYPICSRTHKNA